MRRHAQELARGPRPQPQAVLGFRGLLMSVHGRLTAIERHLGISVDRGPGEEGPEQEAE